MGAGRTPAADERLLRGKRGMEEDAPESGGEWVVWWETLLLVLGPIALLAIVISLLLPTIRMGIFATVAESVPDLAYNLAYSVTTKFIQVFLKLRIWRRVLSPVLVDILGFDIFFFYNLFEVVYKQSRVIYKFLFSNFGIIDLTKVILTVIDQSTNTDFLTFWVRLIFEFLNL